MWDTDKPKSSIRYSSNARTTEELRQEITTDLQRRITGLESQKSFEKRIGETKAINKAIAELTSMLEVWQEVELWQGTSKAKNKI